MAKTKKQLLDKKTAKAEGKKSIKNYQTLFWFFWYFSISLLVAFISFFSSTRSKCCSELTNIQK
jgi:hypothetical protein